MEVMVYNEKRSPVVVSRKGAEHLLKCGWSAKPVNVTTNIKWLDAKQEADFLKAYVIEDKPKNPGKGKGKAAEAPANPPAPEQNPDGNDK